ncbi:MAG: TIGR03808 family TAT-translocated repetitive protein [Hyphomicrobiales bacterium]|nr:TIGR03808 family TAT-translocated repetitive protein [Hyphomicrobiales bacterium]
MALDRRQMMLGGLGIGAGATAAAAGPRQASAQAQGETATSFGVRPDAAEDQTGPVQTAIAASSLSGTPVFLPAGRYRVGNLQLKSGAQIAGVPGRTILEYAGGGAFLTAEAAETIRLSGLVLEGGKRPLDGNKGRNGLFAARDVRDLAIADCRVTGSARNGLALYGCSGTVADCAISGAADTGLFSEDARGLEIAHNRVHGCGNNGIQVWRTTPGEDGTIVSHNRIESIRAEDGGSGQNGNGINLFRADAVLVTSNRIADCAFSAIRANGASNAQLLGNSCARLGEVALYAEFAFEGSIIAQNLVDTAATGISITNFNDGGRLAVAQGNLIRNLSSPKDGTAHGIGIAVEADTLVSGNLVENAAALGIQIGWGKFLRDVTATGNMVRQARIGIGVSTVKEAGYALITNNMMSGAKEGAIRAMNHAKPLGSDLALQSSEAFRNIAAFGNVAL